MGKSKFQWLINIWWYFSLVCNRIHTEQFKSPGEQYSTSNKSYFQHVTIEQKCHSRAQIVVQYWSEKQDSGLDFPPNKLYDMWHTYIICQGLLIGKIYLPQANFCSGCHGDPTVVDSSHPLPQFLPQRWSLFPLFLESKLASWFPLMSRNRQEDLCAGSKFGPQETLQLPLLHWECFFHHSSQLEAVLIDQGSANFICKKPDGKYIRLWGSYSLCHNSSTPSF